MAGVRAADYRRRRLPLVALGAGTVGLALFGVGVWTDPVRAYFSYLTAFVYGLSIALGALFLLMIAELSGATWIVPLRRLAETVAATVPVFALLFLPLVFGLHALYPWVPPLDGLEPQLRELAAKREAYLNVPFFLVRAGLYFVVWSAAAHLLLAWSVRQDTHPDPELTRRRRALSAAALPPVAFAVTFASFDWLMSLSVEWSSTIWGVYYFAGGFVAALGLLLVLAFALQRAGRLEHVSRGHYRAAAGLLLAFVLFWGYVAYAQYFIVWIADLPRESAWYAPRVNTGWGWLALALLAGHLLLPFGALLSYRVRGWPAALAGLGAWMLVMHYLDLYWLVIPALHPEGVRPHWLDAAALLGVGGVAVGYGAWRLRGHPPVAVGDPKLEVSLEHAGGGGG
jgi:hypothetical protein